MSHKTVHVTAAQVEAAKLLIEILEEDGQPVEEGLRRLASMTPAEPSTVEGSESDEGQAMTPHVLQARVGALINKAFRTGGGSGLQTGSFARPTTIRGQQVLDFRGLGYVEEVVPPLPTAGLVSIDWLDGEVEPWEGHAGSGYVVLGYIDAAGQPLRRDND